MAQLKFGSAGVSAREIDLSGPVEQAPVGIPAAVIGTANQGPAFVPVTVGTLSDFFAKFGATDGKKFGPLAVTEWLRNAQSVTYLRVLGAGDGLRRLQSTILAGSVNEAGFVVGEQEPNKAADGNLADNPYANSGGAAGRLLFLGCFMSESAGSSVFSSAGLQRTATAVPIVRGLVLAPSGVIPRLSSSWSGTNSAPASTLVSTEVNSSGAALGGVALLAGGSAKQEFVLLLNGHKGTDALYPNALTASFDMTSPNYITKVLNTDPLKLQQAGHYLYANWDIHPSTAEVTGSGLLAATSGSGASAASKAGTEEAAFLISGSQAWNVGTATVPNYENFQDRFTHAKSPWIASQKFGGNRSNLFRFHALDAGAGISTNFKVSIENIAPSTDLSDLHGSFDVVVRDWADRDSETRPLESFRGVNLDPSSDRYIGKVIGDAHIFFNFEASETGQKLIIDGQNPNQSNLVRVEISNQVDQGLIDPTALPLGFRGIRHMVTSGSAPLAAITSTQLVSPATVGKRVTEPPLPFRSNVTAGSGAKQTVNPLLYWGVQFEHITALSTPNGSLLKNTSLRSFAKFLPEFFTTIQNFRVGGNEGTPDTAANGVIDADRFNLNAFSLDNIQVQTGSNGLADSQKWAVATYARDGNISPNDTNKTRRVTVDDFTQANRAYLKYTFLLQGGFDGVNIFDSDEAAINNAAVTEDMNATNRNRNDGPNVRAYQKALDIIQNTTDVDIQLLVIPGLRHPTVTDAALDAVQTRFDALYLMDIEQVDTNGDLVTSDSQLPDVKRTADSFADRALDSSFGAAYFPDVIVQDPTTKTNVVVPPSVVVLGAFAQNDAVAHPWFAPAGFTRGALPTALEERVKLSKPNMDELYDVDINPLTSFPGNAVAGTAPKGGVIVWGQKTLQSAASALDRVNVRRLLIDLRRQVRDIANTMVFEPNRAATLTRFSQAVEPRFRRVQALAGLQRFKVIIDSSTTTQQDVENNTIRGKIFVQPTKVTEFVSLDFVVTNNISDNSI